VSAPQAGTMRSDPTLLLTAFSLKIDRATAAVVRGLSAVGIPSMLLKGPAIAKLLYDDGASRPYEDCDLLVRMGDLPAAAIALERAGFTRTIDPAHDLAAEWQRHSEIWVRPSDDVLLELHWTLTHVGAAPERAWDALTRGAARTPVCGVDVATPAAPALAAVIALHVAAHGTITSRPVEDLARALERFGLETWRGAASVARDLDATAAFAAGLRRLERGARVADELGLSAERTVRVALTGARTAPRARLGASLLEDVAGTPGVAAKLRRVIAVTFPPPSYMRLNGKPLARRGRLGLVGAYLWRPFDLAAKAGPAWRAWSRARRSVADGR
jgi:hypothetical protein